MEANEFCTSNGWHLVAITSEAENTYLANILESEDFPLDSDAEVRLSYG
jgi:hypothetical protein